MVVVTALRVRGSHEVDPVTWVEMGIRGNPLFLIQLDLFH